MSQIQRNIKLFTTTLECRNQNILNTRIERRFWRSWQMETVWSALFVILRWLSNFSSRLHPLISVHLSQIHIGRLYPNTNVRRYYQAILRYSQWLHLETRLQERWKKSIQKKNTFEMICSIFDWPMLMFSSRGGKEGDGGVDWGGMKRGNWTLCRATEERSAVI